MATKVNGVVVAKAVEIARRWPSPAFRLRGGKCCVPVEVLAAEGVDVPADMVRRLVGRSVVVVVA
jgi:hypothetical protein